MVRVLDKNVTAWVVALVGCHEGGSLLKACFWLVPRIFYVLEWQFSSTIGYEKVTYLRWVNVALVAQ